MVAFAWMAHGSASAETALSSLDGERDGLVEAVDQNADPRIVEVVIEARVAQVEFAPGETIDAWTYNGLLPGPLIRARVGDRLIVHFTNHLPEPTTIHWHGLRIPVEMDGVPGHPFPAVSPGGSTVYDFVVPDAGFFWYHPHVMSAAQVGFGLYGPLLIEDPHDDVGVPAERVLVLSDIGIEASGELESPDSGGSAGMAFGREGNRLLVNGRERPTFTGRAHELERWRVVNAAKSRYFGLILGDIPFTTIGVDGGLRSYATTSDMLVIAPGERLDLLVPLSGDPGASLVVESVLVDRGYGSIETRIPIEDIFTIALTDEPAAAPRAIPEVRRAIEPLPVEGATRVAIDMAIRKLDDGEFQYTVNGQPFFKGGALHAALGETQIWTLTNETAWSHPFHLHGVFFQVLDERERPVYPLGWKDTVDVPYKKTVKVIVRFDNRPGSWMFHCHVLDHADGGLMGMIHVGEVDEPPPHEHK